jgi:biotin operon repressor
MMKEIMSKVESLDDIELLSHSEAIELAKFAIAQAAKQPARPAGRKDAVLAILKQGPAGIQEIADAIDISTKNVSSQLSYLRKDGYIIHTDHEGRKYIPAE